MVKATKGDKTAMFADAVWKSGQPQRYGWHSEEDELPRKKIPAEILEFAEIRKKRLEPKDEPTAPPVEKVKKTAKPRTKKAKK